MKNILARTTLTLAAVAYMFSATACAKGATAPEPTVSANGAISIVLPSNEWKEISYPGACVAFSDGDCDILFDHCGKDEEIKSIDRKAAGTGILYQSVETGKDMDYVFIAYADTKKEMRKLQVAIAKAKIDESKIPVGKHEEHSQVTEDQITVEPVNYTAYVTADSLTIREQPNTLAAAQGSLSYGDEVTVTGRVLVNGVANGWVQIGAPYVCGDFLSTEKPEKPAPDPNNPKIVRTIVTYSASGEYHELYEYDTDEVLDNAGDQYRAYAEGEWTNERTGEVFTEKLPGPAPDPNNPTIVRTIVTYSASGEYHEIYEYSDDSIRDNDGNNYRSYSDGAWTNEQTGEVFTENLPEEGERVRVNDCFADNADGESVHINIYNDGTMFDDNGVQYTAADDGGYTNMNTGDVYFEH